MKFKIVFIVMVLILSSCSFIVEQNSDKYSPIGRDTVNE